MGLAAFSQYSSSRAENVTYSCTALVGSNKAGIIKPDADGYCRMTIGALDAFNSGGAFYVVTERVRRLFDESSILQRRIRDGALRGEYGHPRREPGMKPSDWLARVLTFVEANECVHYKSITLDFSGTETINGRPIVPIYAELRPSGPFGPALEQKMKDPNQNLCFSVRSLTDDTNIGGTIRKEMKTVFTFDYVNEPGMGNAKKWFAASLESIDESAVRPQHLKLVIDNTRRHASGTGLESMRTMAIQVARDLGWDHEDPSCPIIIPRDLKW